MYTSLETLSDTLMRIHKIMLIYELLIQRNDDSVFISTCCFCRGHSLTFQHPHVGQHTRGIEAYRYRQEKYHPKIKKVNLYIKKNYVSGTTTLYVSIGSAIWCRHKESHTSNMLIYTKLCPQVPLTCRLQNILYKIIYFFKLNMR